MTRYLLDTNIISNAVKPQPFALLVDWMAQQINENLFIAALTLAEIRRGILGLPSGRKRNSLTFWFTGKEEPQALFAERILSFDSRAGLIGHV
ncbi:MAG: PIN domain-containing protein [Aestuariivita sp.]|nr:PIN domain-containing protein [Aestuariivita sp.]